MKNFFNTQTNKNIFFDVFFKVMNIIKLIPLNVILSDF